MNIAQNVERMMRRFPTHPALMFEDKTITYHELDEMANRVANGLRELGIRQGERVALFLPNIPAFVFSYLGIQKIGAIAVSLNSGLKSEEVEFILNDSGAKVLVTTEAQRENVPSPPSIPPNSRGEVPHLEHILIAEGQAGADRALTALMANASPVAQALNMAPDAPAAIVYTSGTTGFPKGATLSHANVISNMKAKKRYLDIRPDDRLLLFMPMFHCFGQNAILNSGLNAGATIVLHRKFSVTQLLESIVNDQVTMFFGVPTIFILLYDKLSIKQMEGVRYYFSAAASLPVEIERKWQEKFGALIYQGYGLTETSPFASYNHLTRHKPGSIGTPIEYVEMKIVDVEDGHDLPAGEIGEIVIRGANVMLGYWNRPTETAEAMRNGWFRSGDIGRMDEDGYFYIEDRLKDMINVGGANVYPAEVENVLYQHPAVAEAAIYGVPDAVLGEQVRANIVLKTEQSATEEELIAFCRQRMVKYKVPTVIEFVDELPKSRTGKVLKRVLREAYAAKEEALIIERAVPAVEQNMTQSDAIQRWLVDWLAQKLELEGQPLAKMTALATQSFADLGMNSLLAVNLASELEDWLERPVAATITWRFSTLDSLAHYLATGEEPPENEPLVDEQAEEQWESLSELEAEALLLEELDKLNY